MSERNANPAELFGMRVAHVGINATDPADALEIAELFSTMMGLPVIETPVSYFNLDYQLYPNTSHIHPYMCG